jgi:Cytochrome c2
MEGVTPEFAAAIQCVSAADGEKVFRKCAACHKVEEGKNAVGPSLWGVVGRDVASISDFKYSDAVSGIGGQWTYQKLNEYLTNPRAYAKGTRMAFAGLRDVEDRAAVVKYLNEADGSPEPLPQP